METAWRGHFQLDAFLARRCLEKLADGRQFHGDVERLFRNLSSGVFCPCQEKKTIDDSPEAIAFLKTLPLRGATLTLDAAFTHQSLIEAVREAGASYFLVAKDNQPGLKAELAHAFGDTSPLGRRMPADKARCAA